MNTTNPRAISRQAIEESVPAARWARNGEFCDQLRGLIGEHRILRHPLIAQMESGNADLDVQRYFHLEFRHAFAQIFTDALIQAMVTCAQLESSAGAMGKVAARFLLQLNVLDELGFVPNVEVGSDYAGNPALSHYVQFDQTLRQLGLTTEAVQAFVPSAAARACRATFEDQYADHVCLSAIMATSETVFGTFSGPWARSVAAATSIDVSAGYHSIHVEHDGKFIEDDHSDDAWYVFRQAITSERFEEISSKVLAWLDTWAGFLDALAGSARPE